MSVARRWLQWMAWCSVRVACLSVVGNGNGGSSPTSGFRTFQGNVGPLAAGTHTLVVGGFNSKKTTASESTEVLVDDVMLFLP